MKILLIFIGIFSILNANQSYYKNGKLVELQNTYSLRNITTSSIHYYKNTAGNKIGVKNQILVQCKKSINCAELFHTFNLSSYSKLSDKIFIVKVENINDVFSISRALFESKKVEFAHPDFIKARKNR